MSGVVHALVGLGLLLVFVAIITFVHECGHAFVAKRITTDVTVTVGNGPYLQVPRPVMRLIGLEGVTARIGVSFSGAGLCSHGGLPETTTYEQLLRYLRAGYRATSLLLVVGVVPGLFIVHLVFGVVGAGHDLSNVAHAAWAGFVLLALVSTLVNGVWRRPPRNGHPATDAWTIHLLERRRTGGGTSGSTSLDSPIRCDERLIGQRPLNGQNEA